MKTTHPWLRISAIATIALYLLSGLTPTARAQGGGLNEINHIIVIYQENWSFDSLYGEFPGANGFDNAGAAVQQVDKTGQPYATLPQPIDTNLHPVPDPRRPEASNTRPPTRSSATSRRLLPGAVPDRRRQDGQVRRLERRRRPGHELLRRHQHARRQTGPAVHAGRQLLPRGLRRLVPQPPVPDLRLRTHLAGRPRQHRRATRRQRHDDQGWPGHAGWLRDQHLVHGQHAPPGQRHRRRNWCPSRPSPPSATG